MKKILPAETFLKRYLSLKCFQSDRLVQNCTFREEQLPAT